MVLGGYICRAMKKIIAPLLAIIILSQSLVNVGLGLYYHINKAYIAQQLCINKNNPKLHCNGHCYLSKQLKKAEEGEHNSQSKMLKEKEEIIADFFADTYIPVPDSTQLIGLYCIYSNHLVASPANDIIVPPPIAA